MQREDPAERDAMLERLASERAARLEAALIECDLQAGDEKQETIRSLVDEHTADAKSRKRISRREERGRNEYHFRLPRPHHPLVL